MAVSTEYLVTGMSCAHCEAAITAEISALPGIQGIDVSAETGRLVVTSAAAIDEASILAAVDEAGYAAVRS